MKRKISGALVALMATAAQAQETVTFPARASNIPSADFWSLTETSEGCCIIDNNVIRFDNGGWKSGPGGASPQDNFDWDVPLYAPASGEIAACWRNFPDNPVMPDKLPGVQNSANAAAGHTPTIFGGGNHVVIVTDAGNAMSINHFSQGSIPPELCPSNADNTELPSTLASNGTYRIAAYIEPADRPRVVEGQFIGRVGNSGNSTGPHLHWDIRPVISVDGSGLETLGPAQPLRVRNAWAQGYDKNEDITATEWFRMRGTVLGEAHSPVFKIILASPYLRRASEVAGPVEPDMDVLYVRSNRAVTATLAEGTGEVKLISWDIGENDISREGEIEIGAAKEVRLSEPAPDVVLAAVRQMDDRLKMIAFRVSPSGQIDRQGSVTAGEIRDLDMAMTRGPNRKSVTAVRTPSGDLKLIAWDVRFQNGSFTVDRLGEESAGKVSGLAISQANVFDGVFVAVRTGGGTLRVIPWTLSNDGEVFGRGGHVDGGEIGPHIDVSPLQTGVAAAVQDSAGQLRVITWRATAGGDIESPRRGTMIAHQTGPHRLLKSPLAGSNLTSVMRGGDGNLYLIGWAVDADGDNLRRISSSRAGQVTGLAADTAFRSFPNLDPREYVVTSVRDADGDLRLISWDANLETD